MANRCSLLRGTSTIEVACFLFTNRLRRRLRRGCWPVACDRSQHRVQTLFFPPFLTNIFITNRRFGGYFIQVWLVLQVRQPCHLHDKVLHYICPSAKPALSTPTKPFEGCFRCFRDINDFLEKLITWPRDVGRAIGDCSSRCPTPF